MTTPDRSLEQRLDALAEANRIRVVRADLKRYLKRRPRLLEAVIAGDVEGIRQATGLELEPHDLDTMRAWDAVIAAPKRGRVKTNRLFAGARISPSKTLGGMTTRQRRELLIALGFTRRVEEAITILDEDAPAPSPSNGHGAREVLA